MNLFINLLSICYNYNRRVSKSEMVIVFRRRWLDFRNGHSIYLIFLMTFVVVVTNISRLILDLFMVEVEIIRSISARSIGVLMSFLCTFLFQTYNATTSIRLTFLFLLVSQC